MAAIIVTAEDHARVTTAVAEAERGTDGEIVTIVAARSDTYLDVALHWAVLAMLFALGLASAAPRVLGASGGGWDEASIDLPRVLIIMLIAQALMFLIVRLALMWQPLLMTLTPRATKSRRVRRRAIQYFKSGTERRTTARTGVLLYLSLAEHRAEIVADEAFHEKVSPEIWGQAMVAMVDLVRAGKSGEGMAAAVALIGVVMAEHFPKTGADSNELPDRLIEL